MDGTRSIKPAISSLLKGISANSLLSRPSAGGSLAIGGNFHPPLAIIAMFAANSRGGMKFLGMRVDRPICANGETPDEREGLAKFPRI